MPEVTAIPTAQGRYSRRRRGVVAAAENNHNSSTIRFLCTAQHHHLIQVRWWCCVFVCRVFSRVQPRFQGFTVQNYCRDPSGAALAVVADC
ncbi:hypothetical protein CCHOA_00725 [Corynebacterium choanae]|uniref:Uncharacterized protein n=1 Tax=Corynebacterium choanae TaxID=1862358 RepID=A0A3G6J974_9CORY|nr:hypothetical protein CCHOA_00725 [Corynebacterium choanae]